MSKIRRFQTLAAVVLLGACAGLGVRVEHDPQSDLSDYRNYTWSAPERATDAEVQDPILDSPFMDRKVAEAVRAVLTESGYQEVDAEQADFYVTYHTSRRERRDDSGLSVGIGVGHVWPHRHGYYRVGHDAYSSYPEGTLVIDIIDAEDERLVWRGWKSARISQASLDAGRVRSIVGDILSEFPPR